MIAEVRCTNPSCGRPSRLGGDALGRTFRCGHCGAKLPGRPTAGPGAGEAVEAEADPDVPDPWDVEELVGSRTRTLGAATPTRVGRYQVRGLLGAGTCAAVYRAFDPELCREVALKVPHANKVARPAARERFLDEARAVARLRHPGIVPVYDAGRHGSLPYLATALIEGPTLARLLEGGPLGFDRAAEVAADLAEALGHAHGFGVVHRDVKPANVLVEPDGAARLTDFGLARGVEPGPDPERAAAAGRGGAYEVISGTPAYVAPEQAEHGEASALPASDQYSLGVVLYEMLCGRPPFLGPPALVLYYARTDDPVPPRDFRPGVPRGLEAICLKALARDPSRRYPSCQAMADDLRRWLARSRSVASARDTFGHASRWLRRRPAAALSTLLAVIGVVATTVFAAALVASTALAPSAEFARTHNPDALPLVVKSPGYP
jgi:serine/threonine-protein kinase